MSLCENLAEEAEAERNWRRWLLDDMTMRRERMKRRRAMTCLNCGGELNTVGRCVRPGCISHVVRIESPTKVTIKGEWLTRKAVDAEDRIAALEADNQRLREALELQSRYLLAFHAWVKDHFEWHGVIPGDDFDQYKGVGEQVATAIRGTE